MKLEIAAAAPEEWAEVVAWAAAEGWNPGRSDRDTFLRADGSGFLLGRVEGEPVSAVSVVNYSSDYAFLGFYLVRPELRGRGIGWATWQAGLEHAGSRTIGLDGVVAQQDNYRKSGFSLAYRTLRHSGPLPAGASVDGTQVVGSGSSNVDLAALHAYDSACFPADRPGFVADWIGHPERTARVLIRDGAVAGYGVIRPARSGWRIGPLFADTAADAETLFDALCADASAAMSAGAGDIEPVVAVDIPEPNAAAVGFAQSRGMTVVSETARMYTGPVREVAAHKIYGVTSLELG